MATEDQLVSVFRSLEQDAEEQVSAVRDLLTDAGLDARVFEGESGREVRVPLSQAGEARELIQSQTVDDSHDLDMETVFSSDAYNAEMIATEVRAILEAQGIPTVMVSGSPFPSLPFEIRVPRARVEEARQAIAAAEEAGPAAAEEAERATEAGSEGDVA